MIDFIKEVTWKEAYKFMKELDKRKIEYGMITEWGASIPDNAKFIIELGEEGEKDYIATKGFLQRSDDEVFVRLIKDGKKEEIPNFNDVFDIIDLSENYKQLKIKNDLKN